jgi:hypothetical protein
MARLTVTEFDYKISTLKEVRETSQELSVKLGFETVTAQARVPEIKSLYKGEPNYECCNNWVTELQKKPPTTATTTTSAYAILVLKTKGYGDFRQELKLYSIVI